MSLNKSYLFLLGIIILPTILFAQSKITTDTTKENEHGLLKSYNELITPNSVTQNGLFSVHYVLGKYFFELSDDVLNRDILVVNRLSKSGTDMRVGMSGYAGDQINNEVIRFEKGPNKKIFIRKISFGEYSKDSTMQMYQAVMNSNIQPIAAAFDVKAVNPNSKAVVIDVTDFINSDNDILFFDPNIKTTLRLTAIQPDKSYIVGINTYPINVELKTVKTYTRSAQQTPFGQLGGGTATMEINSSLVLLPKEPMTTRYFDARVGYFTVGYIDFDKDPQGIEAVQLIKRWRLEPKSEDIEKYKRGELVEPKKQIVFYIDPATPKKWVPYLIMGVNDWKTAFEEAGFKNAITAKIAPTKTEDSTWSLDDARFSAIVYKPSTIPNASGPSISDPRSGEIIESHINWYHNVMELLRNWYFIQAAAVDPKAQKMQFDDTLMGQLIRFVSSHEVGHALGLRHNFGASSTVPVENLRNKKWVEANGHTPSIMDYARFNYVAQPEDSISETGLFPRIGIYDKWAIEWGYRLFPEINEPEKESLILNKLTIEKSKNPSYWFGNETAPNDPRCQNEDLGDDAMKAGEYGIKNLKRIVANLIDWTKVPNEDYRNLREIYTEVQNQYMRYIGHVLKNIGGIYETPKTVDQIGAVYEFVPKQRQVEAMEFLNRNLFTTPKWLINQEINNKIGEDPISSINSKQEKVLRDILGTGCLNKLISAEAQIGSKAYTIMEFFNDLQKFIWPENYIIRPVDVYRRNLQKIYLERLIAIINPRPSSNSINLPAGLPPGVIINEVSIKNNDIISIAKAQLKSLKSIILNAIPDATDKITKFHLLDCLERINETLIHK